MLNLFSAENYILEGEKLPIEVWPSPILKKKANNVVEFNQDLHTLIKNMLYTMYLAPGIGLAAPQVGVDKRLFVLDINYTREPITRPDGNDSFKLSNFRPQIFINPKLVNPIGETIYEEGCLSVPGIYEEVRRPEKISVEYQDENGNSHSLDASELLAICIQHEHDHLEGIVFLDRLSVLKRNILKKKILKDRKKLNF